jgi:hypothetical protein
MGRPRIYANDAEKMAAYRARNDLVTMTVDLPRDVFDGLTEYLKFKGKTKNEVVASLITKQLLRKR